MEDVQLPPTQRAHHLIVRVECSEPRRVQQRRPRGRIARVVLRLAGRRRFDGEVPVRERELRVHELKASLEDVGEEEVTRQEADTVVKLRDVENKNKTGRATKIYGGVQRGDRPKIIYR